MIETKTNEWKFPILPPTEEQNKNYYQLLESLDAETKKSKLCEDPEYDVNMGDCLNMLKQGDMVSVNCPKCKC